MIMKYDNKEFKDIPGYRGYLITKDGLVLSTKPRGGRGNASMRFSPPRIMASHKNGPNGYLIIKLPCKGKRKHFRIHRLVAMTWLDNPKNKPCVNHINGNKLDNKMENLEWCTASENNFHCARVLGGRPGPNKELTKKLNNLTSEVEKLLGFGMLQKDIAIKLGIHKRSVSYIKNKQRSNQKQRVLA